MAEMEEKMSMQISVLKKELHISGNKFCASSHGEENLCMFVLNAVLPPELLFIRSHSASARN